MYRYEVKETSTSIEDVVVRKGEDRVAALEYAVEAMETVRDYSVNPNAGTRRYVATPGRAP